MKTITCDEITQATARAFMQACIAPPAQVDTLIAHALADERAQACKQALRDVLENNRLAREKQAPSCQDTGMAAVFADVGQDVHITGGSFEAAVNEGVRQAYAGGYFRKSVLTPLARRNTGDNTPAVLHTRLVPGSALRLWALPKGFGSENMSRIAMLKPAQGRQGILDFIAESVRRAGGNPCPPVFLGIGLGGTFEMAALLSKRALLSPIDRPNDDPELAGLEEEICAAANSQGMGAMGFSGSVYCLKASVLAHPTHLAGLPVAVNFCCHALRHAEATL